MTDEIVRNIANRRELFIDHYLIDRMLGTNLELQTPIPAPLSPLDAFADAGYATVIQDGMLYHAWYRALRPDISQEQAYDGYPGEYTAYMLSADGIHWKKPDLGIYNLGIQPNNAVLAHHAPFSHNFSPMIDCRPGVAEDERFKALAGLHSSSEAAQQTGKGGLYAFTSPDGIHWRLMQEKAVITSEKFAFDSQNISFWSECEGCYVCYYRTWYFTEEDNWGKAYRTIGRRTSPDYIHWTEEEPLMPNEEGEHLYTNQTSPYFRAPHIYISLPTRFMAERGDSTDILFMTSRPGKDAGRGSPKFDRTFRGAFIKPGIDPARWGNRSNYTAQNVVPTGENEMSIYLSSNSMKHSGRRMVLRTDGFAAVHAGWEGGEMVTRPIIFSGDRLEINYSTSAAGSIQVEIQGMDGSPIHGYCQADCEIIVGDQISRIVRWGDNESVSAMAGKPVRLRFVMQEADLFSIRFKDKKN